MGIRKLLVQQAKDAFKYTEKDLCEAELSAEDRGKKSAWEHYQKEVKKAYRKACKEYNNGFASGFLVACILCVSLLALLNYLAK